MLHNTEYCNATTTQMYDELIRTFDIKLCSFESATLQGQGWQSPTRRRNKQRQVCACAVGI